MFTFITLNLCQAVYYALPPSIIGDIAEYSMLKTRQDQSGTYYSIYTLLYKTTIAVGNGVALYLISAYFGFDAESTTQTTKAAWGLKLFMSFIPAALAAIAVILLFWDPLSRKKCLEVKQMIEELDLRTPA